MSLAEVTQCCQDCVRNRRRDDGLQRRSTTVPATSKRCRLAAYEGFVPSAKKRAGRFPRRLDRSGDPLPRGCLWSMSLGNRFFVVSANQAFQIFFRSVSELAPRMVMRALFAAESRLPGNGRNVDEELHF